MFAEAENIPFEQHTHLEDKCGMSGRQGRARNSGSRNPEQDQAGGCPPQKLGPRDATPVALAGANMAMGTTLHMEDSVVFLH